MSHSKNSTPVSEPQIVYTHPPAYEDDEINILELWRALYKRKQLILGVTAVVTLVVSAYAFLAPPVYKAEVFLLPPLATNIQGLNVQALNINEHSPASVYNLFVRNLHSRSFRMRLFKEQNLVELLAPNRNPNTRLEDVFEAKFNEALIVSRNLRKKGKEDFVTVSLETKDAELSAKVLNEFIRLVNAETISALSQNVSEKLKSHTQLLQHKIASKRAQLRREDSIQAFEEATFADKVLIDSSSPTPATMKISNNNDELLHDYLMLQHKLKQLSALDKLEEQLVLLTNVTINQESLTAATFDQWAIAPKTQYKPKRLLIIGIGFMLSLMMGIFLVFVLNSLEQQREQLDMKSS